MPPTRNILWFDINLVRHSARYCSSTLQSISEKIFESYYIIISLIGWDDSMAVGVQLALGWRQKAHTPKSYPHSPFNSLEFRAVFWRHSAAQFFGPLIIYDPYFK